jgi:SAM-dependent methyltransferase
MKENTAEYWQGLWNEDRTKWDVGYPATPIAEFINTLEDKNIRILIPGAGNSYEAEYLYNKGFANVYVMDIASKPLENFKQRVQDFPVKHLLNENFFEHCGKYDLVIEQTFFIAINPAMRGLYAEKMNELLVPGGHLTGLLIFSNEPVTDGPPYLDTIETYRSYFENIFDIRKFETASNSIKPRAGRELFIDMVKKQ